MENPVRKVIPRQEDISMKEMGSNTGASTSFVLVESQLTSTFMIILLLNL